MQTSGVRSPRLKLSPPTLSIGFLRSKPQGLSDVRRLQEAVRLPGLSTQTKKLKSFRPRGDVLGWEEIQALMAAHPESHPQIFYPEHGLTTFLKVRLAKQLTGACLRSKLRPNSRNVVMSQGSWCVGPAD